MLVVMKCWPFANPSIRMHIDAFPLSPVCVCRAEVQRKQQVVAALRRQLTTERAEEGVCHHTASCAQWR